MNRNAFRELAGETPERRAELNGALRQFSGPAHDRRASPDRLAHGPTWFFRDELPVSMLRYDRTEHKAGLFHTRHA